MAERKRPEKQAPTPPEKDVAEKMDSAQSADGFLRDLAKATTNKARKRLGLPSGRG